MNPNFKAAQDFNGVSAADARAAVITLLQYVGEDPKREGLLETPDRFCRALLEMTEGYNQDPAAVLSTTFESSSDEVIILKDIDFTSLCEHHLLSFKGHVHIAYIPRNGKIIGLSKLARIVDVYAQRLQVQERMTQQIATAINTHLNPKGVAVVVEGIHSCMCVRGVKKNESTMVTSHMSGDFRDSHSSRNEFLQLIRK